MRRRTLLPLLLVAAFTAADEGRAQSQGIPWRTDYNRARKEALDKNLPLILDFTMQGCVPCKKLEETTFRDPRVLTLINEKFIPLRVEQEKDPNLVTTLRISGFPTILLASPDGRILTSLEGYQDAPRLVDALQRVLAGTNTPEWMLRDYHAAAKLLAANETARAIALLRNIIEDGVGRAVQLDAHKQLAALEHKAQERVRQARQLADAGQLGQALSALTETIRDFPGLHASRDAVDFMNRIAQNPDIRSQQRLRRAQELLTQAKEAYRTKDYALSLDRCELLMSGYGDLSEGQEAHQLAAEIKNNPELLQTACDSLSDRLSNLYLSLSDALLKKGQRQQAINYLQRVITTFPGTRQAESAQIRLSQLQGTPMMRAEFQPARR